MGYIRMDSLYPLSHIFEISLTFIPSVSQSVHLRASQRVSSVICILIAFGFGTPVSSLFIIFSPHQVCLQSAPLAAAQPCQCPSRRHFPYPLPFRQFNSHLHLGHRPAYVFRMCPRRCINRYWRFRYCEFLGRQEVSRMLNSIEKNDIKVERDAVVHFPIDFILWIPFHYRLDERLNFIIWTIFKAEPRTLHPLQLFSHYPCSASSPTWPLSIEFLGLGRIRGAIRSACVSVWLCADFPSHFQLPFSVIFPLLALAAILGIFNR